MNRFIGHIGSIVGGKLGPRWRHVRLKWGEPVEVRPLFCCVGFFFRLFRRLDPILAPFWLHFGGSGPHLPILARVGRFLAPYWHHFGAMLGPLGARAGTGRAGGVTRSARNLFWMPKTSPNDPQNKIKNFKKNQSFDKKSYKSYIFV